MRCDVKTTGSTRSNEPAVAQFSSRKRQPEHYLGRAAQRGTTTLTVHSSVLLATVELRLDVMLLFSLLFCLFYFLLPYRFTYFFRNNKGVNISVKVTNDQLWDWVGTAPRRGPESRSCTFPLGRPMSRKAGKKINK